VSSQEQDGNGEPRAELHRATLSHVAERAGVSRSTASLAFSGAGPVSDETRERVLAAAAELGYGGPDPRARSLRQGRSGVVGIVFDERLLHAFRDPVNVATLDGIATGLGIDSNGLLLLTETGAVGESIRSAAVDAVVLMGCSTVLDEVVDALGRRGIPLVSIEGGERHGVIDIALDNRAGSRELARHLHALGHRRVGTVLLGIDPARELRPVTLQDAASITAPVTADRLAGAAEVFPDITAHSAGYNLVEQGAAAARALLDQPVATRPTAIMAQSDLLAVGVLRAAEELGLSVPGDLSVTGFDGVRIDGLTGHELTTMRQPAADKGRAAGEAVAALLAGRPAGSRQFGCELQLGDTTGPVPA
jgi:DNA-binding LacI/PurR family transcriptional regulator